MSKINYIKAQEEILESIANEVDVNDIYKLIDNYHESGKINNREQENLYNFTDRENF